MTLANNYRLGQSVNLITSKGEIIGTVIINGTHNEKLVKVSFEYNERNYNYPFSIKTGKLYGCTLPFEIKLKIK